MWKSPPHISQGWCLPGGVDCRPSCSGCQLFPGDIHYDHDKGFGCRCFYRGIGAFDRLCSRADSYFRFSLSYKVVPNRRVEWRDALLGGLIAGLLFAGLRWMFGIYLIYFPTYQTIYGALLVVPVFLVWMFASWTVVLAGAVIAASGPSWRGGDS